jgi:mRNA-degrading endonuclease RelE of RelBE toxin-antitoxin system
LFLDLNAKGIETSEKFKTELKMLCKHHQDYCEREMKVLGRRIKGIIASGLLAGTRMD